jgi:hypothetical protein
MRFFGSAKHSSIRLFFVFLILALLPGMVVQANEQTASIYDIQYTEDVSGNSPYFGQEVNFSGIVTAVSHDGFVVAEAAGPWQAVFVYSINNGPEIGDEVEVTGTVNEYYGMTQIVNVTSFQHISSGNHIEPELVNLAQASQEQFESVLITVEDVVVAALLDNGEWAVVDETAQSLLLDDRNDYLYFPKVGDSLESVTGILFYSFGAFKLEPRYTYDIAGEPIPHYALHGNIVTMNENRDVIYNGYLEIVGDEIIDVRRHRPRHSSDIPVIRVSGLIFPGLIDAHNHPVFDVLGPIPFQSLFTERYQWLTDPLYDAFKDQFFNIANYGGELYEYAQEINMLKLAEVRALTAGTTSIQGSKPESSVTHQGIIINNVERFSHGRVYSETFPLQKDLAFWELKSNEYWSKFVIHLSEGTTPVALGEFNSWKNMGMLDARTTIIHGIPYGPYEWLAMAEAGASLIWSPVSNLYLYGETADIPGALEAGVNIALSPDWTESGSLSILDELKEAHRISRENWGSVITPRQFAEFVTRNAAKAIGAEKLVGQIATGYRANLMVIPGFPWRPYRALLRATPAKVKLTVVNGRPMYGNPNLLARFGFVDNVETVTVGGREKSLAIQIESHAIPESDKPFAEISTELEEAYEMSEPKVSDFVGIE